MPEISILEALKKGRIVTSPEAMIDLAKAFASALPEDAVLGLSGDLGTGKTTFVKGLGQAWGIPNVTSPSYNLLLVYEGQRQLLHVDAYRLKNPDEFDSLYLDDLIKSPYCIAIEWPENIQGALPIPFNLSFSIKTHGAHEIRLK